MDVVLSPLIFLSLPVSVYVIQHDSTLGAQRIHSFMYLSVHALETIWGPGGIVVHVKNKIFTFTEIRF